MTLCLANLLTNTWFPPNAESFGRPRRFCPHLSLVLPRFSGMGFLICATTICLLAGCQRTPERRPANVVESRAHGVSGGVTWLMGRQHPDDLWHSEYYGNLKEGAAVTALALYAISFTNPDEVAPYRKQLQAAVDKLTEQVRRQGCVANRESRDYPTYASAMFLIAVDRLKLELSPELQKKLVDYLLESQLDETEELSENDLDFGGWDMEGTSDGKRATTGTNISVGAVVAEALAKRPSEKVDTALGRFRIWLGRCHNLVGDDNSLGDGGFFFHPVREHDGNKAGWVVEQGQPNRQKPRSYGTSTADGLRGLSYAGTMQSSGSAILSTSLWLSAHPQIDRVPGIDDSGEGSWSEGLLFYYWYSLAQCLDFSNLSAIKPRLREEILRRQSADGSWQNANARMREDDPLIATSFALIALAICESTQ